LIGYPAGNNAAINVSVNTIATTHKYEVNSMNLEICIP